MLEDLDTVKEITIVSSRKLLEAKVKEAGPSPQHIKGHSLRIGGATAYAKSPEGGSITAGFLGLWASEARWTHMHAYRRPLELAGLAVARETGAKLAVTSGLVGSYAQGNATR